MERSNVRWGWIVVAVLVALTVVVSLAFQTGGCAGGGAGAAGACSTTPVGGWPAAWVRVVVGALLVTFAVVRGVRRPRP